MAKDGKSAKEHRLAEALRKNLRRRKDAARDHTPEPPKTDSRT